MCNLLNHDDRSNYISGIFIDSKRKFPEFAAFFNPELSSDLCWIRWIPTWFVLCNNIFLPQIFLPTTPDKPSLVKSSYHSRVAGSGSILVFEFARRRRKFNLTCEDVISFRLMRNKTSPLTLCLFKIKTKSGYKNGLIISRLFCNFWIQLLSDPSLIIEPQKWTLRCQIPTQLQTTECTFSLTDSSTRPEVSRKGALLRLQLLIRYHFKGTKDRCWCCFQGWSHLDLTQTFC